MLKKIIFISLALTIAQPAHAEGWLDSVKGFFGMGETEEVTAVAADAVSDAMPNSGDMVKLLTDSLGVTESQATGGLGSLFNYAKTNLSSDDFSSIAKSIPGLDSLTSAIPSLSADSATDDTGDSLSGLLDKASEYSDSLGAVNDVKKQFEALGLSPDMITKFADTALQYLDTEQGQSAKKLLQDSFGSFVGG